MSDAEFANQAPPQGNEFSHGWPVMSAAAVGIGLGMSPLPFYTLGALAGPIMAEFGWSAKDVFVAIPVYTVGAMVMAPVIGHLADKYGARRVSLISIILFGLAMMAQSLHTGDKILYIVLWAFISLFGAGTLPVTFTRAVNNNFHRHRGKALGIALIATGMFGALSKYFAQELQTLYDWRTAYVALGFLPILIAFPLSLLSMRDISDTSAKDSTLTKYKLPIMIPAIIGFSALAWFSLSLIWPQIQEKGLQLEYAIIFPFLAITAMPILAVLIFNIAKQPVARLKIASEQPSSGLTLKQSFREWRLWLLCICLLLISYALGSVIPLLEQVLGAKGFSAADAVAMAALTGIAVLAGRVIGGILIDKFWAPGVAFIFMASPALALYLLAAPDASPGTVRIAILMIGFGAGVEYDFLAYLVSKYFGMRAYSSIYGFLYAFFGCGAGFGTIIMASHAASVGWDGALIVAAIVLIIGTVPLLTLGKYRSFPTAAAQT